jgi:hypothetical protein
LKQRDEMRPTTNDVEEKLRKQQLTKPLSKTEMSAFCHGMLRNLELDSKSKLSDIRGWAENWQSKWFRSN